MHGGVRAFDASEVVLVLQVPPAFAVVPAAEAALLLAGQLRFAVLATAEQVVVDHELE
ncbi:hypothetical protein D3C77_673420 [compost metagenome]